MRSSRAAVVSTRLLSRIGHYWLGAEADVKISLLNRWLFLLSLGYFARHN